MGKQIREMATEVSSSVPSKALSPPSKKKLKKTMTMTTAIAEDIVNYNILPRLPFKSLCRFKSVCKKWNHILSGNDPLFARLQPLCCSSTSISLAAATVSLNKHGHIAFLPTLATSPIDVPAPLPISSFLVADDDVRVTEILASTNGLLCLLCSCNHERFLYLCNPATNEAGHRIPIPSSFCKPDSIGLAFDPSKSKSGEDYSYMLVHPVRSNVSRINGVEYRFTAFSSQHRSRGWTELVQIVATVENHRWKESKPVFANGVLYWYCTAYLLWFSCCENELSAGYILMPQRQSGFIEQEIGVCGDRVTCTRLSGESLDVWMLQDSVDGSRRWEQIYQMSLERMVHCNTDIFSPFYRGTARLRSRKKISDGLVVKLQILPLPFEGGNKVFFRVMPRQKRIIVDGKKLEKQLLGFDMNSGKMAEVFRGELFQDDKLSFGYTKSLVRLPK